MAALSGAAAGGAVGGIAGALVGLGIPEYEAKQYEGKVKNGNILISVHTDDSRKRQAAKEIFERAHAEDISALARRGVYTTRQQYLLAESSRVPENLSLASIFLSLIVSPPWGGNGSRGNRQATRGSR